MLPADNKLDKELFPVQLLSWEFSKAYEIENYQIDFNCTSIAVFLDTFYQFQDGDYEIWFALII